jgi:hypothetical protein
MTTDTFDELQTIGRELRDIKRLVDCAEPCAEKTLIQTDIREVLWSWLELLERLGSIVHNYPAWPPLHGEFEATLTHELKPVLVVLDRAQAFVAAQKRSVN